MSYSEYIPFNQNPQFGQAWGQAGQGAQGWGSGLGQAAFGQQGFGGWQQGGGGWQQGYGGLGGPWQRQFSQQDVGEIVRHLVPLLPLIVNQAQQPHAAFGYGYGSGIGGGFGGGFGQRNLSQQDVGEVVRQILPVIPQIVSLLQGQQHGPFANAISGGLGWGNAFGGQGGFGQGGGQGGYGQGGYGQGGGYGQHPLGQAAFGNVGNAWGSGGQRQLNPAEVGEIVRHLTAVLPQVIGNLQAFNQNQQQQRAS